MHLYSFCCVLDSSLALVTETFAVLVFDGFGFPG